MNRSQFNKVVVPGLFSFAIDAYKPRAEEEEWRKVVSSVRSSRRSYEEDVYFAGLGMVPAKPEGTPISYDEMVEGPLKRWGHKTYGLGVRLTEELIDDALYPEVGSMENILKALGYSAKETLNILTFDIYNNGTVTTNHTAGDGLSVFSTAHTSLRGPTWSNQLSPGADLSATALQTAIQNYETTKDDSGKYQLLRPRWLLINPASEWKARELLHSTYDPESPNNSINSIRSRNLQLIVSPYFTVTKGFVLIAEPPIDTGGLIAFLRRKVTFSRDGDFDTGDAKFKSTFRFSIETNKPNHLYYSPGA